MANITITAQSLLNTAVYNSYTIDNGQTVDQLKTAINTARSFNSTWYDLVNGNVLTESSTLASLGIVTGTVLRTHNKIGRLSTRQARQEAKLALATLDRTASSKTYTLTIDNLPTKYSGNTLVNNANGLAGGVITNITITTPFSRNNGSGWNPDITTIGFDSGGGYTSTYVNPTATPIFNGSNFLSGITVVTGGSGWIKHPGPGLQQGQVIIDIFIIQDNSTGDPDTREIKNTTNFYLKTVVVTFGQH